MRNLFCTRNKKIETRRKISQSATICRIFLGGKLARSLAKLELEHTSYRCCKLLRRLTHYAFNSEGLCGGARVFDRGQGRRQERKKPRAANGFRPGICGSHPANRSLVQQRFALLWGRGACGVYNCKIQNALRSKMGDGDGETERKE